MPFNENVIPSGGLDYFENNNLAEVGQVWYLTGSSSGRTWYVSLPAGFAVPDHVQPLLNAYSWQYNGVVCIGIQLLDYRGYKDDINYTNVNDCGANAAWPVGYQHDSATDYSTMINNTATETYHLKM